MTVNHEVKGNLAKLLATENLVIEHKKVQTASFDVINRVLTLPIWDRASGTVYDLLVGHEVGHALYTPAEDWRDSTSQPIPPDYVNVIEDARIEKLMKRKYPGLRSTFYNGYQELNQQDFFSIANEDVSKMSLIDRINLHFKVGNFALIPFTVEEQEFVDMTSEAMTFADVLYICEQIVKFLKEKHMKKEIESPMQEQVKISGSGSSVSTNNDQQDSSDEDSESSSTTSSVEEQDNSEEGKNQPTGKIGGDASEEEISKTQRSFDSELENLNNKNSSYVETDYVEIPDLDIDKVIVDLKILRNYITDNFNEQYCDKLKHWGNIFENTDQQYRNFKKESTKEVNYLVKEFECKKSADAYSRSSTSRTGVLDTKMLHTYKYNEDLFKKVSIVPDGKNHGLIFILDWSGSMNNYLLDTVKQLLNLVWFCRKVQIPFEVYAFTYDWSDRCVDEDAPYTKSLHEKKDGFIIVHDRFSLLNLMSSRANSKELETDCINLWRLAVSQDAHGYCHFHSPNGFSLSGTPLNESVIALHKIIPMFKNREQVQKVNVVILTDGESNGIQYSVDVKRKYGREVDYLGRNTVTETSALRDRKTGNIYRNFGNNYQDNVTSILLENIKDNYPYVNLIGFRILSGQEFGYLYRGINNINPYYNNSSEFKSSDAIKEWRKQNCYEFNNIGYDALYAISSSKLHQDCSLNFKEDSTETQVGKAFRDMMKTRRTSKKILSSFATLVS